MNPEVQRKSARFLNVPKNATEDCDIEVIETDSGRYRFAPYPFGTEDLRLYFKGRNLKAGATFDSVASERQCINICRESL
jgi:hypothetical protein